MSSDNSTPRGDEKSPTTISDVPVLLWDDVLEKRNPKNWPLYKKIFHTVIPCTISFLVLVIHYRSAFSSTDIW